jgi:hypothetical protein
LLNGAKNKKINLKISKKTINSEKAGGKSRGSDNEHVDMFVGSDSTSNFEFMVDDIVDIDVYNVFDVFYQDKIRFNLEPAVAFTIKRSGS